MNELIKVTTNEQGSQVVSARELHEFLEIRSKFADWFKNRVSKYGFIEDQDFTTFSKILEKGRPEIDYALTLDTAKELAMVEGNDKGKQARQYFIECEKQLRQVQTNPNLQLSRKDLAMMVIQIEEEKERLQAQLDKALPKLEYVDQVLNTDDCVVTSIIANELGYSAKRFNEMLHKCGIQWKVDGCWVLTAKYAGKGYHQMRTHTYSDSSGQVHSRVYMVWTQRGRAFLHWYYKEYVVKNQ